MDGHHVADDFFRLDVLVNRFQIGVEHLLEADVLVDSLQQVVKFLGYSEEVVRALDHEPATIHTQAFGKGDHALEHLGYAAADAGGIDVGPHFLVERFGNPA